MGMGVQLELWAWVFLPSKWNTNFNIITKEWYTNIKSLSLNCSRAPSDTKTPKPNGKKQGTYSPMRSHNLWGLKVKNQSIDDDKVRYKNKSWQFESWDEYITTVKTLYT